MKMEPSKGCYRKCPLGFRVSGRAGRKVFIIAISLPFVNDGIIYLQKVHRRREPSKLTLSVWGTARVRGQMPLIRSKRSGGLLLNVGVKPENILDQGSRFSNDMNHLLIPLKSQRRMKTSSGRIIETLRLHDNIFQ
ncbi:hypothetical protein K443DRAFT_172094 [Laccaria amethystina LaAM-08-1]|uniref:Unplaced genomic scaffold K443scaffold_111, whole genome shotgun sequence n=1 Tax=Laccaria amethystina LaAM-08-1 TaxID=1095629 RepID=A0A0C9XUE4_9AGAR|nr:hypothetical protein K443DRAFT_172094 [Laccaria amethystina LaAM-08-1]